MAKTLPRTRAQINGDLLNADIKESGFNMQGISRIIGCGDTFVHDACKENLCSKEALEKIAAILRKPAERYLAEPTREPTGGVQPDFEMLNSTMQELRMEIRAGAGQISKQNKCLEEIEEALTKIISYVSMVNAKCKSIDDSMKLQSETKASPVSVDTKVLVDNLKDIGANVSSIRANASRHYETEKTQIDKLTVAVNRKGKE